MNPQGKEQTPPAVNWIVRPYQAGDEQALPELAERSNGHRMDLGFWRWLFRDNPAGASLTYFADDHGTLAGHYAIVPFRVRIQGQEQIAYHGLEAMTHPDYRRQGIMVALTDRAYADAAEAGGELIYGFPNSLSIVGLMKYMDFFMTEALPVVVRPLDLPRVLAHQRGEGLQARWGGRAGQWGWDQLWPLRAEVPGVTVTEVDAFPDDIDDLCRRVLAGMPNAIIRDRAFLQWRYCQHPVRRYRIYLVHREGSLRGFCVTGRFDFRGLEIGVLLDLFGDPEEQTALAALGSRALLEQRREGLPAVAALIGADSLFRPVLQQLGFRYTARTFPFIVRLNGGDLRREAIAQPADWYLSFGDSDFV